MTWIYSSLSNTHPQCFHMHFLVLWEDRLSIWFVIDSSFPSKISSLVWMFANIKCSNAGYLACCCRRPFIQSRVHAADWLRPNNAFPTIELLIKSSDKASFSVSTDASSTFSWHLPDGSSASNGAINWHIRRTRTETSFLCNQFSSWAMHGLLILSYHYQRHNPLLARE